MSSAFGPTAESCLRPHCRRLKANRRRGRPRYRLRQSRRHGEAANPAAAPTPPHSQCAAQPAPSAAAAQPLPALDSALASPSAGSAPAAEPAAAAIRRWPPPPWASLDPSEMQEARSVTRLPAPHPPPRVRPRRVTEEELAGVRTRVAAAPQSHIATSYHATALAAGKPHHPCPRSAPGTPTEPSALRRSASPPPPSPRVIYPQVYAIPRCLRQAQCPPHPQTPP